MPLVARERELCAFVQARMSSRRFPGKVLAPFRGRPLIDWVLEGVRAGVPTGTPVVVATSDHVTDDPLAAYLATTGRPYFRGPLRDVLARFRGGLTAWRCEWVLRISADSPLINAEVIRQVVAARNASCDLVTTIFPRTFPKGQNAELIRTSTLLTMDSAELVDEDREHVTRFYYRHPDRFRIVNVRSTDAAAVDLDFAVDSVADLERLENVAPGGNALEGWVFAR